MSSTGSPPKEYFMQERKEMLAWVPHTATRILDVGCGAGIFGSSLKQREGIEVWGIELEEGAASRASKVLDRVLTGNAEVMVEALPDHTFDVITCNDILEHLVDPFSFIAALKRKLIPGGRLICSIPNVRFFDNLLNLLVRKDWRYEDHGILDRTHMRFFTKKSIKKMLQDQGYVVESLNGINGYITSWKFSLLIALSLGYLSDTAPMQFACVARADKELK